MTEVDHLNKLYERVHIDGRSIRFMAHTMVHIMLHDWGLVSPSCVLSDLPIPDALKRTYEVVAR